jgi:anti-sigma regulatory factor (Ser/Thr protein kinase)
VGLEECADFECDPAAVGAARAFVRTTLRTWGLQVFEHDAEVLASELVTNAVLHARTEMRLTLAAGDDGSLRVSVFDENPRLPISAGALDGATSGRGLLLVENLADAWGVEQGPDGKIVWAKLIGGPTPLKGGDDDCIDITEPPGDEAVSNTTPAKDRRTDRAT